MSYSDDAGVSYNVFSSGLTQLSETVTGLTPGVTYKLVVQARNLVSLSTYSEYVEVLAAQEPDAPLNMRNVPSVTSAS